MVIGLTGSIACGKSLISRYLKYKGYKVIDSDLISHNVLLLSGVKEKIVNIFSDKVLNNNNEIDRKVLETIILKYKGGPVGLETLAAAIGEEAVTIEDVYEPYLMQIPSCI